MILAWNVRGMNNAAKHIEVGSYLNRIKVCFADLFETRIKSINARRIQSRLGRKWSFLDNYRHHGNGRIWVLWDKDKVNVQLIGSSYQYLHCMVMSTDNTLCCTVTVVYALNHLNERKKLGDDICTLASGITGPWCILGDFNNVLHVTDRIGGNPIQAYEYADLESMMTTSGLSELPMTGHEYTRCNKHTQGVIYSKIDRALGNMDWFQVYQGAQVEVLDPGVSDYCPLYLNFQQPVDARRQSMFKFMNCAADTPQFLDLVRCEWDMPMDGRPGYIVWRKLKRMQSVMRGLMKGFNQFDQRIAQARADLETVQKLLQGDNSMRIIHGRKSVQLTCYV